jgi:hypothetical protein
VLASVHSEPHGSIKQQVIVKISAYQIPSEIVVFVILIFKSYSQKPQEALNFLALFYMPLHRFFLHNLLIVLIQIVNKMGLKKYPAQDSPNIVFSNQAKYVTHFIP